MSKLQRIQAWLRRHLSKVLGDTVATLIANQMVAIVSGIGILGILFFLWSQALRIWQAVTDTLQVKLPLFDFLLVLLFLCIALLVLSGLRKLRKKEMPQPRETPRGETGYFFYKKFGYNWKISKYTGKVVDASVYCPQCQTELTFVEEEFFYLCLNCKTQVKENWMHIRELRTEVEKLTMRLVRGKLPQL
jgi:hypothetical protein